MVFYKHIFFIFFILVSKNWPSQSITTPKLQLLSQKWTLIYSVFNSKKKYTTYEKKYVFHIDGSFEEVDGKNLAKGKWNANLDTTKICWTYDNYNSEKLINIKPCENFRYSIIYLTSDSLKLSILGREGTAFYIFSSQKQK